MAASVPFGLPGLNGHPVLKHVEAAYKIGHDSVKTLIIWAKVVMGCHPNDKIVIQSPAHFLLTGKCQNVPLLVAEEKLLNPALVFTMFPLFMNVMVQRLNFLIGGFQIL